MAKLRGPRGVRYARNRGKVFLVPTMPEDVERASAPHHTSGALALDGVTVADHATLSQRLVVIVERETGVLSALQQALDHHGDASWSVQTFASAQTLLTFIQHDKPSVILLGVDHNLIGEEAYYQRLRSLSHLSLDLSQVIFVTSLTSHELSACGVTSGVVLRTPILVSEVLELIREALATRS